MPTLPMPIVLACIASAYSIGTKVAHPVGSLLKPLLIAAGAGAAVSRPGRGILGPFRLCGHALSFLFGFVRNGSLPATTVEMFKISATEELVTVYIRRDVYQIACSTLYLVVFIGGSYIFYKLAVYTIYKMYTDVTKSWNQLQQKNETSTLTKEQLKAISYILQQPKTLNTLPKNKNVDTVDPTSFVVY